MCVFFRNNHFNTMLKREVREREGRREGGREGRREGREERERERERWNMCAVPLCSARL